jgi:phosphoribosylcarboxyaminoimidazole (NCAIR) mutase
LFRHKTTHRTNDCSTPVRHRIVVGLSGIIADAGGVTHVPGMVAAMTSRAVIGVTCQDVRGRFVV